VMSRTAISTRSSRNSAWAGRGWRTRLRCGFTATTAGTRAARIVDGASALAGLGEHFGAGLYAAEVDYLIAAEWARSTDDILWRRTKGTSAKPTALGILRAGGARNPHLHPSKLRFLRSGDAQPAFARYGFAEVP